jgi:hypothetical protein
VTSSHCAVKSVSKKQEWIRPRAILSLLLAFVVTFFFALTLPPRPALALPQESLPSEYQLKAAFLFNFAKFVEWPTGAFSSDTAPITLCILGDDPFGHGLDDLISGKKINNRDVAARRTRSVEDMKSCQVVFISSSEDRHLSDIVGRLKGAPTLAVGESPGFAERGGEIQFYLDDGKIRFSINVDAVQRAHLTVSAKLLALAKIVHDDGHSTGGMR